MVLNGIETKDAGVRYNQSGVSIERLGQAGRTSETAGDYSTTIVTKNPAEDGTTHKSHADDSKAKSPSGRQWTGPDCSWSWVIAVACSLLNFFAVAVVRSGSVLYVNAIEYYGITRADASWPPSLVNCVSNLSGLVTGYLTRRFGPRYVALAGAILSCLAISSCYFADSIDKLTIICGVFHGLGMGLNQPAVAVCLNLWFDKKKVIASGIIYTGAALASLFFPSFLKYAMYTYGFSGGFALLGAVMSHAIACALLIRMPPWLNINGTRKVKAQPPLERVPTIERFDPDHPLIKNNLYMKRSVSQHSFGSDVSDDDHAYIASRFHEAVHHHTVEPVKEEADEDAETSTEVATERKDSVPETVCVAEITKPQMGGTGRWRLGSMDRSYEGLIATLGKTASSTKQLTTARNVRCESVRSTSGLSGATAFYAGGSAMSRRGSSSSVHRLRLRSSSSAISMTISMYSPSIAVECSVENDFEVDKSYDKSHPHQDDISPEEDVGPNALIYLVGLTYIILVNCNTCFQTIMVDHAIGQGMNADRAIYLLWGFALSDIAGRLCVGLISDMGLMSRPAIMGCAAMTFGTCLSIAPFVNGFLQMMILCMFIGFSLGTSVVLVTVLVGDYSDDLTRITMYIGWMGFGCGVTGFGRPYIIGFFRDTSGHYGGLLGVMGACMFSCGVAWNAVHLTEKIQHLFRRLKSGTPPEEGG